MLDLSIDRWRPVGARRRRSLTRRRPTLLAPTPSGGSRSHGWDTQPPQASRARRHSDQPGEEVGATERQPERRALALPSMAVLRNERRQRLPSKPSAPAGFRAPLSCSRGMGASPRTRYGLLLVITACQGPVGLAASPSLASGASQPLKCELASSDSVSWFVLSGFRSSVSRISLRIHSFAKLSVAAGAARG